MNLRRFYVYVLFRPTGTPCYVGKGTGNRWQRHEVLGARHPNRRLAAIVSSAGGYLPKIKVREHLQAGEAAELERALVAAIGWGKGQLLANMTAGGGGTFGYTHSAKTKKKISAVHLGRVLTQEHRAKISNGGLGRIPTEETKQKLSDIMRQPANLERLRKQQHKIHLGAKRSEETKGKIRVAALAREARKRVGVI